MSPATSQSLSPDASLGDGRPERPKLLEALGSRVTVLTRSVAKLSRKLPIVGSSVGYAEDVFCNWLEPVITHMETDGLHLLSLVDGQIHKVSDVAVARLPFAWRLRPYFEAILSGQPLERLSMTLDMVARRGVVGSTADIWVEYEPIAKNKAQAAYNLASKLPFVSFGVHILRDVGSPILSAASDWLVTHSEIKDKHEISLCEEAFSVPPASDGRDSKPEGVEENKVEESGQEDSAYVESPVASADVAENSGSEGGSENAGKGEEPPFHVEGKLAELTVTHEDDEQDELSDLFDTWGMGGKAISPNRLKSLRTHSMDKSTGTRKARNPARPFVSLTKSFRL